MPDTQKPHYPEVVEFLNSVMRALNVATAQQLGDLVGMTTASDVRKLQRWIRGQNRPRLTEAIVLLKAAGLLTPRAGDVEADPDAHLRSLADTVASIHRTQAELAKQMRTLETQLRVPSGVRRPAASRRKPTSVRSRA